MTGLESALIGWLEQIYRALGYAGLVLAMALESACIPLPSEIILPLAGWMVARHVFTFWGAVLAGTLGGVLGSTVAYGVGMHGGRLLVVRYGRYFLLSVSDLDRADCWFARYGQAAVFVARLVPVVRTFISLPAGIARMPFGRFLLYTTLGSLSWSLVLVYAGVALGDHWEAIRPIFQKFDVLVVAAHHKPGPVPDDEVGERSRT